MKKKLLTLLMALVAIVACAFDQGDFNYSVNSDGTARTMPAATPMLTSLAMTRSM